MSVRAIPKVMLSHTVTLRKITGKDAWGKETLSEPTIIDHVKLEPSTKYVRDKQNNEIQLAAVMIYDCKNSRPGNQEFTDSHVVIFNGETYQIQMSEPLYDNRRLHHYEVGLIRRA